MWGKGILNGMRITFRNMLRGNITVKYPFEKLELPERSRWAVHAKFDEEGNPMCTGCMACIKACPDNILDLHLTTREDKTKHIERYTYDIGACMMCGLCVEACPFSAIEMSHEYELATTEHDALVRTLLCDVDAASAKKAIREPADPAAKGAGTSTPAAKLATEGAPDAPASVNPTTGIPRADGDHGLGASPHDAGLPEHQAAPGTSDKEGVSDA